MKEKLLALIGEGRRMEEEKLVPRVHDSEPPTPGEWTTKDVVAHLTAWRNVAVGELEVVLDGAPIPELSTEDDVENAKIYAQTHSLPAKATVESATRSWDELATAIGRCTEEQLQGPRPRYPDQKLWQVVPNNTYFHLAQHLDWWYTDLGDEPSAEQSAVWGHDLLSGVFPEDRQIGLAEYNLGCFYARRGNAAKALPLLQRGFELRPELRQFANEDADLDPIRSSPEVAALLQG